MTKLLSILYYAFYFHFSMLLVGWSYTAEYSAQWMLEKYKIFLILKKFLGFHNAFEFSWLRPESGNWNVKATATLMTENNSSVKATVKATSENNSHLENDSLKLKAKFILEKDVSLDSDEASSRLSALIESPKEIVLGLFDERFFFQFSEIRAGYTFNHVFRQGDTIHLIVAYNQWDVGKHTTYMLYVNYFANVRSYYINSYAKVQLDENIKFEFSSVSLRVVSLKAMVDEIIDHVLKVVLETVHKDYLEGSTLNKKQFLEIMENVKFEGKEKGCDENLILEYGNVLPLYADSLYENDEKDHVTF